MADRWSDEFSTRVREWCDDVAALGVDVLADAGLVSRADFERAALAQNSLADSQFSTCNRLASRIE